MKKIRRKELEDKIRFILNQSIEHDWVWTGEEEIHIVEFDDWQAMRNIIELIEDLGVKIKES